MTNIDSQKAGRINPECIARAMELRNKGLVHVTGLPVCHPGDNGQLRDKEHTIQASKDQLGCVGTNNGKVVLITPEGEVWLGTYQPGTVVTIHTYKTRGGDYAFVPCSNGETIYMGYILDRLADPYSDCNGRYTAIPNPR